MGAYVRRWCPELANLPSKFIHKPWTAPESLLEQGYVKLGHTYPQRIPEDIDAARLDFMTRFKACRQASDDVTSNNCDIIRSPVSELTHIVALTERSVKMSEHGSKGNEFSKGKGKMAHG